MPKNLCFQSELLHGMANRLDNFATQNWLQIGAIVSAHGVGLLPPHNAQPCECACPGDWGWRPSQAVVLRIQNARRWQHRRVVCHRFGPEK